MLTYKQNIITSIFKISIDSDVLNIIILEYRISVVHITMFLINTKTYYVKRQFSQVLLKLFIVRYKILWQFCSIRKCLIYINKHHGMNTQTIACGRRFDSNHWSLSLQSVPARFRLVDKPKFRCSTHIRSSILSPRLLILDILGQLSYSGGLGVPWKVWVDWLAPVTKSVSNTALYLMPS